MELVKEKGEDIIPSSPWDANTLQLMNKKKRRHCDNKSCFNPYSTLGLDKFARMSANLFANREYVSRKTRIPEAMVRFAYTRKGWVLVVLKFGYDGGVSKLTSLPHVKTKQDSQCKENHKSDPQEDGDDSDVNGDEGCGKSANGFASKKEGGALTILAPWWSRYLEIASFVVQKMSAILTNNFSVFVVAMLVFFVGGFSIEDVSRWCHGNEEAHRHMDLLFF